jgi:electron transport complex protein RnfC
LHEDVRPVEFSGRDEFLSHVRKSGIVGLGGAGFPTHVKLAPPPGAAIDSLIVNGAECEPYITADDRFMVERPQQLTGGITLILDALGIPKAYIAIEDNKPEAIRTLEKLIAGDQRAEIISLPSRYPRGAEKMLIYSCLGRRVPPGKLPSAVNAVVLNVNTVGAIYQYFTTGEPLTKKLVTVTGSAVRNPSNIEVLIGTPLSEAFDFCGGFKAPPKKVLMGGPMMGIAQFSLDVPVVKHTNALLAFDEGDAAPPPETSCIRCGKCVDSCPMRLLPLYINSAAVKNNAERLEKYHVADCIECGICEYNCPAKRRIVQSARLGKGILQKNTNE